MKKYVARLLVLAMLLTLAAPVFAEEASVEETAEAQAAIMVDAQKLDASYTLALNAINAEDYETAKVLCPTQAGADCRYRGGGCRIGC